MTAIPAGDVTPEPAEDQAWETAQRRVLDRLLAALNTAETALGAAEEHLSELTVGLYDLQLAEGCSGGDARDEIGNAALSIRHARRIVQLRRLLGGAPDLAGLEPPNGPGVLADDQLLIQLYAGEFDALLRRAGASYDPAVDTPAALEKALALVLLAWRRDVNSEPVRDRDTAGGAG